MKTKENVGFSVIGQSIKEKVKAKEITARAGWECLVAEARANGGENGVAVLRGSKTANWLARKIGAHSLMK